MIGRGSLRVKGRSSKKYILLQDKPKGENEYNMILMNIIDKIYTRCPFYGYPRITHKLKRDGHDVNHKRIHRLRLKVFPFK